MALREHRRELDKLLEETEREIKALVEFWENCLAEEKEDSSPKNPWISRWHLGHPLDLNDECLREDPGYDEEKVEQEALQDYLQELQGQRARVAIKQAASQKRDAAASGGMEDKSPTLLGKHSTCAKALPSLSQGRPPTRKKPCVFLSIAGEAEATRVELLRESGSPSSSREEEEAAVLLRKTPKRNLQCGSSGTSKTHTGDLPGKREQLQRRKQVSGYYLRNCPKPATDQSSEESETSPSSFGKGHPLKPYNFRRQSKQVNYACQQEEEEEESSSEGKSEEDWVPEEEESEAEEEEDAEEMEVEEEGAETEEESEDVGPAQAEPQRQNRPQTVRSYRCPECDREFSNSSNMQKPLRIHKGELPYGCHVCSKSYTDPSNLTKHQVKHKGERRHPCPVCPKAFYVKSHLDAHMRHHQGIRSFACLECRSTFCSRVDLLAHMKIHVVGRGRQPLLRCTDCDKTFAGPKLLRLHRKHHKNLVCEVFASKFKYKSHRSLHASCVRCGVSYVGTHLCQGIAQNAEHPECVTRESSVSFPQGVVTKQPVATAAHAGSQEQPIGSTQAVTRSSGTDGPSVSASSRLSTDGQVRLLDLASTTSFKEPSHLARTDTGDSERNESLSPATCPIPDGGRSEPSSLARTPLQLKPAGDLLQDTPVVWPVTSSPAIANPSAPTPALPGLVTLLPSSQALAASPVLAAAPPTFAPMADSHPKPLTFLIPVGPPQLSVSNPASQAANNALIWLNPAPLPAGNKTNPVPIAMGPQLPPGSNPAIVAANNNLILLNPATLPASNQTKPLTVPTAVGLPQPSGSNPANGAVNNGLILLSPALLPTGSQTKPLTVPIQVGPLQPSGSNLVSGTAKNGLFSLSPATLPTGSQTKSLTVPIQVGLPQLSKSNPASRAANNGLILRNPPILPAGSQTKLLTVLIPVGQPQPSKSNPASGTANNILILHNPATFAGSPTKSLTVPIPVGLPQPSKSNPASGTANNGLILHNPSTFAGSPTKLVTVPIPVGLPQPSKSNPASGTANNGLILHNPATFAGSPTKSLTVPIPVGLPQPLKSNPASGTADNDLILHNPATFAGSPTESLTVPIPVGPPHPSKSNPASRTANNGLILHNPATFAGSPTKSLTVPIQVGLTQPLKSNPASGTANNDLILHNPATFAGSPTESLTVPITVGLPQLSKSNPASETADNGLIHHNPATFAGSPTKSLTVPIPVGLMQASKSNPASGTANNDLTLRNLAMLPAEKKVTLEIPSQKIVPPVTAQICAVCQAKYVGTHQCRKLPQDPDPYYELIPEITLEERTELDKLLEEAEREIKTVLKFWENCFVDHKEDSSLEIPRISERREEEEPKICQLVTEESTTARWKASLVHPPLSTGPRKKETVSQVPQPMPGHFPVNVHQR